MASKYSDVIGARTISHLWAVRSYEDATSALFYLTKVTALVTTLHGVANGEIPRNYYRR